MEQPLNITALNDFIFCPVSIYFHLLYDGVEKSSYQSEAQINGTYSHKAVDTKRYTGAHVITSLDVYCQQYDLIGKIDMYNTISHKLIERKNVVKAIYDGYVFQLYAQCFAMREMGYTIDALEIHSMKDNRTYPISLPENDPEMLAKFENTVHSIQTFQMDEYQQTNPEKCAHCIYEPYCDRGIMP